MWIRSSVVVLAVLPHSQTDLGFLPLYKDTQLGLGLIGDSELPECVTCLCAAPVINSQLQLLNKSGYCGVCGTA